MKPKKEGYNMTNKRMKITMWIWFAILLPNICGSTGLAPAGEGLPVKVESQVAPARPHVDKKVQTDEKRHQELLSLDCAHMLQEPNKLVLPPLDMDAVRAGDERRSKEDKKRTKRIGVVRSLQGMPLGQWAFAEQKIIDGMDTIILQQAIISPGARVCGCTSRTFLFRKGRVFTSTG